MSCSLQHCLVIGHLTLIPAFSMEDIPLSLPNVTPTKQEITPSFQAENITPSPKAKDSDKKFVNTTFITTLLKFSESLLRSFISFNDFTALKTDSSSPELKPVFLKITYPKNKFVLHKGKMKSNYLNHHNYGDSCKENRR